MTEEIIIDNVNVAECFYFIDHTPPKGQGDWCGAIHKGACKVYSKDCEYNKDCYYKQLKRSEQENKELKKFCIELEKQKEKQHNQWFERCTENHNEDSKIIENYHSALEEIREIAMGIMDDDVEETSSYYDANLIINKINEVLK